MAKKPIPIGKDPIWGTDVYPPGQGPTGTGRPGGLSDEDESDGLELLEKSLRQGVKQKKRQNKSRKNKIRDNICVTFNAQTEGPPEREVYIQLPLENRTELTIPSESIQFTDPFKWTFLISPKKVGPQFNTGTRVQKNGFFLKESDYKCQIIAEKDFSMKTLIIIKGPKPLRALVVSKFHQFIDGVMTIQDVDDNKLLMDDYCSKCYRTGHLTKECVSCYYCHDKKHLMKECQLLAFRHPKETTEEKTNTVLKTNQMSYKKSVKEQEKTRANTERIKQRQKMFGVKFQPYWRLDDFVNPNKPPISIGINKKRNKRVYSMDVEKGCFVQIVGNKPIYENKALMVVISAEYFHDIQVVFKGRCADIKDCVSTVYAKSGQRANEFTDEKLLKFLTRTQMKQQILTILEDSVLVAHSLHLDLPSLDITYAELEANNTEVIDLINIYGDFGLKDIVYANLRDKKGNPKRIQEYSKDGRTEHNCEVDSRFALKSYQHFLYQHNDQYYWSTLRKGLDLHKFCELHNPSYVRTYV